jgi:tyrosinase
MKVEIDVAATSAGRTFLTWAPVKAKARLADASDASGMIDVTLRNGGTAGGGRVVFDSRRRDDDKETLDLQLPADGSEVEFWVAGAFQQPSLAYGDAAIEAAAGGAAVGRRDLMVRIRKDAAALTDDERDRFLAALGKLNDAGKGIFQSFRMTHIRESAAESHGYPGFPPWHRAYLLDLERELQRIDDSVALPYWRFDRAAPGLFAPAFLGMPPPDPANGDQVQFPHGHPLEFWQTDQAADPIERRPRFDIAQPPSSHNPDVLDEATTLNLGSDYPAFRGMEGAPHGPAHTSFDGPVNFVPTAAKDPLFFLLHANVDRLWAKWQWREKRCDPDDPAAYSLTGRVRQPNYIGHKLDDTMWPWNGETTFPRPSSTPRGTFPDSPVVARPGGTPVIRDMIDFQGVHGGESLGFDYDDVPFELI